MADVKKYYYLKLKENFFDSDEIKIIETLPNGYLYINILLKLYCRSLKRQGKLMVTDRIPYSIETLSKVVGHNIDVVRNAIEVFKEFKLVEILDNGAIFMSDIQNFIGKSSNEADRKREYRMRIESEKQCSHRQITGQMSNSKINENSIEKMDESTDKCPIQKKQVSKQAISYSNNGQMSDFSPPKTEIETEIETEIQQIERIVKCSNSEAKVIFNTVKKYQADKDVVAVVTDKLKIIDEGNYDNRIGALVDAIKKNWIRHTNTNKNGFNNFEPRKYDYKALEDKLLGWD